MPAITKIKLRAGSKSAWAATSKTKSLTSAQIVGSGSTTAVRYTASGGSHSFQVKDIVTITGFSVSSGNNPYNISGGAITAIASGTFDISVDSGTTGGTSTGTGTATFVALETGEAAVETDTNKLRLGDGVTAWDKLDYVNQPLFYVLSTDQDVAGTSNEQNLFDNRLSLRASSTYSFEIQAVILCGSATDAKNIQFGFYQTGMTAWSDARYSWVYGSRENASTHYATGTKTVTGTSPVTSSLIALGPNTTAGTDDVVFFTIRGIVRTGAGSSSFQPRIKFSSTPGTGSKLLKGSYMKVDLIGDSPFVNSPKWVSNV